MECAAATFGDSLIVIAAVLVARALTGPAWSTSILGQGAGILLAVGLIATLAPDTPGRRTYGPEMACLLILRAELAPIAQCVVIPLVVSWWRSVISLSRAEGWFGPTKQAAYIAS